MTAESAGLPTFFVRAKRSPPQKTPVFLARLAEASGVARVGKSLRSDEKFWESPTAYF